MKRKSIFIVRHGETDYNRQNIVQGSGVDMEINEFGRYQAQRFFEYYQHVPFQHIFTSALIRTRQSVAGFINKGIKHTALPELNEISWGDFEGKLQTEEQKQVYWDTVNLWKSGNLEARIPNGETPLEMQKRQKKAAKLILKDDAQHILICMHGRAMKSFLCSLLNKPLTQMEDFQHTNFCLYHLEYDGLLCHLIKANDTTHLI